MNNLNKNTIINLVCAASLLLSSLALAQTQTKVYRTEANADSPPELQVYDVVTDNWTVLTDLPDANTTQLATSATDLFALPEDGNIYAYDSVGDSWDFVMAGPAAAIGRNNIAMFETWNGEFYWATDSTTTLHYTVGGVWTSASAPYSISSSADFDRINGILYIRTYGELGHFSFDANTSSFANGCPDNTNVGENSRAGAFYQGDFYSRTYSGNLIATNVSSCGQFDTGVALTTEHSSTAVDDDGNIYVNGYAGSENTFEVLDLSTSTRTSLADSPDIAISGGHATLAIIRNGTAGPGTSAEPIPTLSQWATAIMILLLSVFAGRRLQARNRV